MLILTLALRRNPLDPDCASTFAVPKSRVKIGKVDEVEEIVVTQTFTQCRL